MGDGGFGTSTYKPNTSTSVTKDNSQTGDSNIGGEGNFVNIGSDDVANHALATVKDVVSTALDTQLNARTYDLASLKALATNLTNTSDAATSEIGKLAETKITDGANLNQKTTMVALAVAGAVVFFMRKR